MSLTERKFNLARVSKFQKPNYKFGDIQLMGNGAMVLSQISTLSGAKKGANFPCVSTL